MNKEGQHTMVSALPKKLAEGKIATPCIGFMYPSSSQDLYL